MTPTRSWKAKHAAFVNRLHAARAGRKSYSVDFTAPLDTLPLGDAERGRQIYSGRFAISGRALDAGKRLWDLPVSHAPELQSFAWLDDLCALGDGPARARAQGWVAEWIDRFGAGEGWEAPVVARRLWHWHGQLEVLLHGLAQEARAAVLQSFARQLDYLGRTWAHLPQGAVRLEVLAIYTGALQAVTGFEAEAQKALAALETEVLAVISPEGDLPTRRPEGLLDSFAALARVSQLARTKGQSLPQGLTARLEAMGQVLRGLRHGDGALVRFHGGGAGQTGLVEAAFFAAGLRGGAPAPLNMGYARLTAGRLAVFADAAVAPRDPLAHASALAIEVSIGRRPLIVSCGDGSPFGEEWRIASRAPASHSGLVIEGGVSLTLHDDGHIEGLPSRVLYERSDIDGATRVELAHNGWSAPYGLVHARQLDVTVTGRSLEGEDLLMALTDAEKAAFDRAFALSGGRGLSFAIRFHLHPDVVAMQDAAEVTFVLKSGEVWVLRAEDSVTLSLDASVYLEKGQARPRAAQQVVLTGHAMSYATRIRWRLLRAHETSDILRARQPN